MAVWLPPIMISGRKRRKATVSREQQLTFRSAIFQVRPPLPVGQQFYTSHTLHVAHRCCTMARPLPDSLVTKRLALRKPREADALELFKAYTQDGEVTRFLTWRPHVTVSETERFVVQCLSDWMEGQRQPYVLTLQGDAQRPIGMLDARLQSHILDVGYVLARPHWGRGLMPEAVLAVTETALALPRFFRVQATCDVENRASARVLEKSGFTRDGRLERYIVHPNVSDEPRACYLYARHR